MAQVAQGRPRQVAQGKSIEPAGLHGLQRQVLEAEKKAAVVDRARAELELEKQRISQLIGILSDFSTQATFLAGCAIAAVGGESLESIEDETKLVNHMLQAIFVFTSGIAVASSIWVIFIASHLVSLTRDAALKPKIRNARDILEKGVRDVRAMLWLSLASLILSTVTMAWLNASTTNASIFTFVMFTITWQACSAHTARLGRTRTAS